MSVNGTWRMASGLLFGLLLLAALPASAEWMLTGDLMQARYAGPGPDGNWTQELLPSRDGIPAVAQTRQSLAWDVGLGYRFADGEAWYSKLVSVEAGYRHYGSGVSAGGLGVSDEQYGAMVSGAMRPHTVKGSQYEATDRMQGGYLRVSKGVEVGYGFELCGMGGVEILYHDLNMWGRSINGKRAWSVGYSGIVAGPTVGGGVKYHVGHGIQARALVEQHWMVTESGHPVTSSWLTVGGGLEVPLAGWW